MKAAILAVLLAATSAAAQDKTLVDYLKDHASIVSGVASANGERTEYVSLSVEDDFIIRPKLHGLASLSLFGRQRASDPALPSAFEDLSLYSAGEIQGGAYFELTPQVALETRFGMTFDMIGLTGKIGDPVDASKFLAGVGLRLTGGPGRLSVLAAHYGPVQEGAALLGFIPTGYFDGEFRLPKNTALLVRVAAGRRLGIVKDGTDQGKAVTSSWFAIRKGF